MVISLKNMWSELYILLIVLFPIINNYSVFIPIGDILAIILLPIFYLKRRKANLVRIENTKNYFLFLIFSFFSLLVNIINTPSLKYAEIFAKNFHIVLYAIYALYLSKYFFNLDSFTSKLKKVIDFVVIIEIIEQIIYMVSGKQLYLLLPFLRLNYTDTLYSDYVRDMTFASMSQGYRPSSLFLEPAHFASVVIIGLVFRITENNKSYRDYIFLLMYVFSIFISRSTGGIVSLGICCLFYLFFCKVESQKERKFKYLLGTVVLCTSLYLLIGNSSVMKIVLSRIGEIGSMVYDTSGNRRVLRGYLVFGELSNLHHFIGTGFGNLLNTITLNGISVLTDTSYTEEMAQIPYLLCSTGIIGTILYYYTFLKKFIKRNNINKLLTVIFVLSGVFNNYILQASCILYMVCIFNKINNEVVR